jgi:hypothetical protein
MSSEKQVNLSDEEFKLILAALEQKYDAFFKALRIMRDDVLKDNDLNVGVRTTMLYLKEETLKEASKIPMLISKLRDAQYRTKRSN